MNNFYSLSFLKTSKYKIPSGCYFSIITLGYSQNLSLTINIEGNGNLSLSSVVQVNSLDLFASID